MQLEDYCSAEVWADGVSHTRNTDHYALMWFRIPPDGRLTCAAVHCWARSSAWAPCMAAVC